VELVLNDQVWLAGLVYSKKSIHLLAPDNLGKFINRPNQQGWLPTVYILIHGEHRQGKTWIE
jgi:hypothetical protein